MKNPSSSVHGYSNSSSTSTYTCTNSDMVVNQQQPAAEPTLTLSLQSNNDKEHNDIMKEYANLDGKWIYPQNKSNNNTSNCNVVANAASINETDMRGATNLLSLIFTPVSDEEVPENDDQSSNEDNTDVTLNNPLRITSTPPIRESVKQMRDQHSKTNTQFIFFLHGYDLLDSHWPRQSAAKS